MVEARDGTKICFTWNIQNTSKCQLTLRSCRCCDAMDQGEVGSQTYCQAIRLGRPASTGKPLQSTGCRIERAVLNVQGDAASIDSTSAQYELAAFF